MSQSPAVSGRDLFQLNDQSINILATAECA
jgi:hypothetical protein